MKYNPDPLNVLIVDDEEIVHRTLGSYFKYLGHQVDSVYDGKSALEAMENGDYGLALVDIRMPGMDGLELLSRIGEAYPEVSVVIITGHGNMDSAVQALRLGAADFLTKPIELELLDAIVEKTSRLRDLKKDRIRLRETIGGMQAFEDSRLRNRRIVGTSAAMDEVREQVKLAVEAEVDTVLITGETGTGKEVVAREIHFRSGGDDSPFIAVSCPAIPDSLLESELFGHVKGSFTGATVNKAGAFELADGGTLFLDEISDLSESAQAKLLRVLETRSFRRIGGAHEINVDIRVVAATNVPLEKLIKDKKFRQDLFFRLNVFAIRLLPLRERKEDIMPLAKHFLALYCERRGTNIKGFKSDAENLLMNYDFPGNARELRNLVERAAIVCRSDWIGKEHFAFVSYSPEDIAESREDFEATEKSRILDALRQTDWNRRKAADVLEITYSSLRYKMKKFQID